MTFIKNKYTNWYYNIVNNAKCQARKKCNLYYYESHHIIPRSLGGTNSTKNLVLLTTREHFICHLLLTKMVIKNTPEYYKMVNAVICMRAIPNKNKRYVNSRLYKIYRNEFIRLKKQEFLHYNRMSTGTIWVFSVKLNKSIKIKKEELEFYTGIGYVVGRCMDFKKRYTNTISKNFNKCVKKKPRYKNIEIVKNNKIKIIKYNQLPSYKRYGWVAVGIEPTAS